MATDKTLDEHLANTAFEIYDKFQSQADAKPLIALLKANNIPYEVEKPKPIADAVLVGEAGNFTPKLFVKIRPQDFQHANQLVEAEMIHLIESGAIDIKAHYLYDYSNEELLDVLRKPDEWNYDVSVVARYLLQSRGVEMSSAQITQLRDERVEEIRKPKKANMAWIIALFALNLMEFVPIWGGRFISALICLGMGYYYWKDKSVDPNGQRFYTFDASTRRLGMFIFIISIVFRIAALAYFYWPAS